MCFKWRFRCVPSVTHQEPVSVGTIQSIEGYLTRRPRGARACSVSALYQNCRGLCALLRLRRAAILSPAHPGRHWKKRDTRLHSQLPWAKLWRLNSYQPSIICFSFLKPFWLWKLRCCHNCLSVCSIFSEVLCDELVKHSVLSSSSSSLLKLWIYHVLRQTLHRRWYFAWVNTLERLQKPAESDLLPFPHV